MQDTIDEIKKRIDIVDFLGNFITLKKAGRNFKALCPFHQEKTPSFVVSPERQIWHCFGSCGEGGDIIKFLMKWENITFVEALRELAEKAGVKLQRLDFEDRIWKKKERLIAANNLAAEYFHYLLFKTKLGKRGLDYLKNREINPKIADKFHLGYAPSSWDSLLTFMKKKKFSEDEILEAGLLVRGERGSLYDRFRGRIMFPIADHRGNIIGFSGRSLDESEKEAKYINTPETPIYHKRENLYGIQLAKEAIKKEKNTLLVEGEFDVISSYQHGIENIVGIKGSAVTREQLLFLKRYGDRVTLALDADSAGEETIRRTIDEAESLEFETAVVTFDFAKDPDEAIRKEPALFKKAIKEAIPIYDFVITYAQKKNPKDDPFSKKKIGDEVVPVIAQIRNPIVQAHYIKRLASVLDVSEGSITAAIRRLRDEKKRRQFFTTRKADSTVQNREDSIQKYILSILFQGANPYTTGEKFFSILSPSDFSTPANQKIIEAFLSAKQKNKNGAFDVRRFAFSLDRELQPVFDELYLYASYDVDFEEVILDKLIYEIKKNALKRQIKNLISLSDKPDKKQEERLREASSSLKEVEKKLATL